MKRSVIETILGAVVLVVAAVFLFYGYNKGGVATPAGLEISADFTGTGGLNAGDSVVISGVKVGSVKDIELAPESYLARVHMSVDPSLELSIDTSAMITSESLLGGKYLVLEPGAEEEMLKSGGRIQYTQAPQNLEQLLGQFIFSMNDSKDGKTQAAPAMKSGDGAAPSLSEDALPVMP